MSPPTPGAWGRRQRSVAKMRPHRWGSKMAGRHLSTGGRLPNGKARMLAGVCPGACPVQSCKPLASTGPIPYTHTPGGVGGGMVSPRGKAERNSISPPAKIIHKLNLYTSQINESSACVCSRSGDSMTAGSPVVFSGGGGGIPVFP